MDEPGSVLDTGNVLLRPSRSARLLLFVALPVYLLAFAVLRPDRDPEMWEPGAIAERLRAGDGYALIGAGGTAEATANQEPVYPLVLALLGKWMLVIQVILWLFVARLLAWLAHRLVGAPEAWTAIAVALWPPLVVYVLRYHPLTLRSSCLVLALSAAFFYRQKPSGRRAVAFGLALGMAALTRATFYVLPVLLLPWAMGRRYRHAALALGVAALVVAPWIVRNRLVLDAWVPGTTTSGLMALSGNHPGASGVLDDASLGWAMGKLPRELWFRPEPERDRLLRDRALAFWLEHPSEAMVLYIRKLAYLWTWRPGVGSLYTRSWTVLYLGIWLLALPAMLAGAWLAKRNASSEGPLLFLGTWVLLSLVYALFAVNMRFRFESEPLLVPYMVMAIAAIVARARAT